MNTFLDASDYEQIQRISIKYTSHDLDDLTNEIKAFLECKYLGRSFDVVVVSGNIFITETKKESLTSKIYNRMMEHYRELEKSDSFLQEEAAKLGITVDYYLMEFVYA